MRVRIHEGCGGTILTGSNGTVEEHNYCDRCDWVSYVADQKAAQEVLRQKFLEKGWEP